MCTRSVADSPIPGKPGIPFDELEAHERRTTPIEGWSGRASRQARRRDDRKAGESVSPAAYLAAHTDALERRLGILDRSWFNLTDGGSRRTVRHAELILTEAERARLRHMARQAEGCGSRWAMYRGWESGEAGEFELRLACPTHCGTRACPRCYKAIREREQFRVWGPWSLFFTFTVPRERASIGDAWREVHVWIEHLVREMRREAHIASISDADNARLKKPFSDARRAQARARIRAAGPLRYAWVIEPHKTGYPHIHMVVDSEWADFGWLRDTWQRACGVFSAWVYGERVYQVDGACRYLAKYISKAQLSLDILCIVYRRRLWATNLDRPDKPEPKWYSESRISSDDARAAAESGDDAFPEKGWELVSAKRNKYAIWKRPAKPGFGYVWSDHWEQDAAEIDWSDREKYRKHLTYNVFTGENEQYSRDIDRIIAMKRSYG